MNPVAPMTFIILKSVLDDQFFSQRMIMRQTGVSLGQVNKVFQWLEENNFIEKIRKTFLTNLPNNLGVVRYQLVNPTGLLRAISLFRTMNKNIYSVSNLDISKEEVIKYLKDQKVVFCLETALEKYDSHFRGDTICCYISSQNQFDIIHQDFQSVRYGLTKVTFYSWDFAGLDVNNYLNSRNQFTTEVQTIIDLFCDNKAHYTKELLKKKWRIEL